MDDQQTSKDNEEEAKLEESTENSNSKENDMMKQLFYMYYKHKITGPYNHYNIKEKFIAHEITDKIWVKNVDDADRSGEWYQIILSPDQTDDDNKELKDKFPDLYDNIIPDIRSKAIRQCHTPVDIPEGALKKISTTTRFIEFLGKLLVLVAGCIVGLHILPTALFSMCCCLGPWNIIFGDKYESIGTGISLGVGVSGLVIVPFIIVYNVLLDAVDAEEWNGEIQSWMIGYITWGIVTFLGISMVLTAAFVDGFEHLLDRVLLKIFWIIGVDFDIKDKGEFLNEHPSVMFGLCMVVVFPALAAMLPSAIVGFIANFVLEEKFELKCNDDITSDLCAGDEYGCCEVISSHDVRNTYSFVGGLASNILATWAVIRIAGYLMVNMSAEISMFAKRNK